MLLLTLISILLISIANINAEIIDHKLCPVNDCIIHETRIEPCPEGPKHIACKIHRRKEARLQFDFTPQFDADSLEQGIYWAKSETEDLPLVNADQNACNYTPCPVKNGVNQTLDIALPIDPKFPLGTYTVKWVLRATNQKTCCLKVDIKIVR